MESLEALRSDSCGSLCESVGVGMLGLFFPCDKTPPENQ